MKFVYLIYEDDYGGMLSPYVLTKVFREDQREEAYRYLDKRGSLATLVKTTYNGLELSGYKQYLGGWLGD
jgi:hypothetical protein